MKQIVGSPVPARLDPSTIPIYQVRSVLSGTLPLKKRGCSMIKATPFQCSLRDCTYSAPFTSMCDTPAERSCNSQRTGGTHAHHAAQQELRVLRDKSERFGGPQGVPRAIPAAISSSSGIEKVILIQEQLSKNRVILEEDAKGISASSRPPRAEIQSLHSHQARTSLFEKQYSGRRRSHCDRSQSNGRGMRSGTGSAGRVRAPVGECARSVIWRNPIG